MAASHQHHTVSQGAGLLYGMPAVLILCLLLIVLYTAAAYDSSRRYRRWPMYRTLLWTLGVLAAGSAVGGPIAYRSHDMFTAHMAGHLLLGMLAPLLMVWSAPVTLLLRTLSVSASRGVTQFLKSRYIVFISHPVTASFLNVGGLWILYSTDLFALMHEHLWIQVLVHVHVFFSGYLFTASIIYIDPVSHRFSYKLRIIVLLMALAWHGILAKHLVGSPPAGVPANEALDGSMLMYYGGDVVHAILITLLCYHWYRSTRPRAAATDISRTVT
ncbi:cytochrome c oxidase assembly protein [Paenibacillus lemnae]|uniref:Cytochrome c oxidase assembly protein n=1 Tax=Paenibacillus lemnae TaxID=1330551 RepID=A0A848M6I3_PAELE|nr:cytochrome c oxidase assembly protein [Paenibacillus lemnae]NMO95204.1 cytochrome c oxidase assembly protein [Paenibacillus lemnae]